ncbi:MAG: hypothetical protein U0800_26960 [Isosphaeraceae bacterium]
MRFPRIFPLAIACAAIPAASFASNPPVDRAGPLTVRIDGPETLDRTDRPFEVKVIVKNEGERPIDGTLEIGLIDGWKADGPSEFSVGGVGETSLVYSIRCGNRTYNAHYPIHAYARFVQDGKPLVAHPILLTMVKASDPPSILHETPWSPYPVRSGSLAIWRLPAWRAAIRVFDKPFRTMKPGWRGTDESTGATADIRPQTLPGGAFDVVAIHPPYRDGQVGTAIVEFPLTLPDAKPIRLEFRNAVVPEGKGDGVTFRVRAAPLDAAEGDLGAIVYDHHANDRRWGKPVFADLSRFAGRSIRLQLESDPGPKRDTGWDQSFWAEPTLIVGKAAPEPTVRPLHDGEELGTVVVGKSKMTVKVRPGARGLLDATIGFVDGAEELSFRGFAVRVLGQRLDDPRSPIALAGVQAKREGPVYRAVHQFQGPDGSFDLVATLAVRDGVLRASFDLDRVPEAKPWRSIHLEDVSLKRWNRPIEQVYAGHGNVVRKPEAFTLNFDGHRLATSFVGIDFDKGRSLVMGVDVPPASFVVKRETREASLHAPHPSTFTFIPAPNAFEGAIRWREVNGLKASAGVPVLAGRFVFDLWSGRYAETARELQRSFRYGLGGSVVVFHNWQRWGYDYRLPDIYPPNPQYGTEEELRGLIVACKAADTRFALHDNYIDYYPDADDFSYEKNIAFDGQGRPVRAWLNEGRGAQSYRYRADRVEPYVSRNIEQIRKALAPTAYFIDVWTSIHPYDYWTDDGAFRDGVSTRNTWGEQFARIRDQLGDNAPAISESGHDQLIGWVDGAQTNHLRIGRPIPNAKNGWTVIDWRCRDAERTPWFDAAHHDRFVNHGAGYPSRYEGGLDPRDHGIDSDDYIATEVLTGHPGMVARPFGPAVVRKHWLTNDLMQALALARIEAVEYVGGDLHRQHVRWSTGETWVNRGESDWKLDDGTILPAFGFLAKATGKSGAVEAAIYRDPSTGLVVDRARSGSQLFVNGRLPIGGPMAIRPTATAPQPGQGRSMAVAVRWDWDEPIPGDVRPFLHACDESGEIAFQLGHDPIPPDQMARPKASRDFVAKGAIPESARPGQEFEIRAGLYRPEGGHRLALLGPDDGSSRIRLARFKVGPNGQPTDWRAIEETPGSSRQNPDGKPVEFGGVATPGGVRLTRDSKALVITPLPSQRGRSFDVVVDPARIAWPIDRPKQAIAIAEDGREIGREPIAPAAVDGPIPLKCRPGVFQYRLSAE